MEKAFLALELGEACVLFEVSLCSTAADKAGDAVSSLTADKTGSEICSVTVEVLEIGAATAGDIGEVLGDCSLTVERDGEFLVVCSAAAGRGGEGIEVCFESVTAEDICEVHGEYCETADKTGSVFRSVSAERDGGALEDCCATSGKAVEVLVSCSSGKENTGVLALSSAGATLPTSFSDESGEENGECSDNSGCDAQCERTSSSGRKSLPKGSDLDTNFLLGFLGCFLYCN